MTRVFFEFRIPSSRKLRDRSFKGSAIVTRINKKSYSFLTKNFTMRTPKELEVWKSCGFHGILIKTIGIKEK